MSKARVLELLADEAAFRDWLNSKAPSAVVGVVRVGRCCPLARFLAESGQGQFYVNEETVCGQGNAVTLPLPAWAREFVQRLDWRSGLHQFDMATVAEALATMDAGGQP